MFRQNAFENVNFSSTLSQLVSFYHVKTLLIHYSLNEFSGVAEGPTKAQFPRAYSYSYSE